MATITITYPADARTPHAEAAALAQRAAESAAVAVLRACALGDMATAQALAQGVQTHIMARLERENARLRAVVEAAARANTDPDELAELALRALRGEEPR